MQVEKHVKLSDYLKQVSAILSALLDFAFR